MSYYITLYVFIGCLRACYIFWHCTYTEEGRLGVEMNIAKMSTNNKYLSISVEQLIFVAAMASTVFWLPEFFVICFFRLLRSFK